MIASQAKRISSFCISNGVIDERDREKFDYCYEVFLSTLLNFAAVLLIGLATGSLWHTVVFMLVFAVLKALPADIMLTVILSALQRRSALFFYTDLLLLRSLPALSRSYPVLSRCSPSSLFFFWLLSVRKTNPWAGVSPVS